MTAASNAPLTRGGTKQPARLEFDRRFNGFGQYPRGLANRVDPAR
jgi:hypothetical protein